MKRNLPQRKNIRLESECYTQTGYYFITICIKNRLNILGKIYECRGGYQPSAKIELTKFGRLVEKYLKEIPNVYRNVKIDEYVIMPNHIHLILILESNNEFDISTIIGQFKRKVSKEIKCKIGQKLFYDHIIRNDKEYYKIKEYIQINVERWEEDKYWRTADSRPYNIINQLLFRRKKCQREITI